MTITATQSTMMDSIQPYVDKLKSVNYRKHLITFAQYILIIAVAIGKAIRWATVTSLPAFASWRMASNISSRATPKPSPP